MVKAKVKYTITIHYEMVTDFSSVNELNKWNKAKNKVIDKASTFEFPDSTESKLVWIEQDIKDIEFID